MPVRGPSRALTGLSVLILVGGCQTLDSRSTTEKEFTDSTVQHYEASADKNHQTDDLLAAEEQLHLGNRYYFGKGVAKNHQTAAHWYQQAAKHGLAEAQYNLGVMYDFGQGVAQNDQAAAYWYLQAAEQGHSDAQYVLGLMYALGKGVPQNSVAAYALFNNAAAQGHESASKIRDQIAEYLSNDALARAQQLSREYYNLTIGVDQESTANDDLDFLDDDVDKAPVTIL